MPSKHNANKVAGYLARLIKQRETEKTRKVIEAEIKEDEE
jgi:ribosomal protein S17E